MSIEINRLALSGILKTPGWVSEEPGEVRLAGMLQLQKEFHSDHKPSTDGKTAVPDRGKKRNKLTLRQNKIKQQPIKGKKI